MVLFLQADIHCFTMWQWFIQAFLYINILPTFLVLSHASFYVAENKMSNSTFILTCLFPIPTIIIYHLCKYLNKAKLKEISELEMMSLPSIRTSSKSNTSSDFEAIVQIPSQDQEVWQLVKSHIQYKGSAHSIRTELESDSSEKKTEIKPKSIEDECLDSGKEITKNMLDHYKTLKLFGLRFTWLAIHKMYRIALVACNTYLTDPLMRLLTMSILLIFIFTVNTFIKPYKTNETNVITTLSYLLNILIAILNICKAVLEKFSCKNNCSFSSIFIKYVDIIENVFLVYIPVVMISLFMFLKVLRKCKKKDKAKCHSKNAHQLTEETNYTDVEYVSTV